MTAGRRTTRGRPDGNARRAALRRRGRACPADAVGKADPRGNLYPAKARPERKIDAAVALMMAIGRALAEGDGNTVDLDAFLSHPVFA